MTTLRSRLTDLTVRLASEFKKTHALIGDLRQLETLNKQDLVSAINEARETDSSGTVGVIDDSTPSTETTFSSEKVNNVVAALLSDSTIEQTRTWSSQRIREAINRELTSLVRGSPRVVDSLFELSTLLEDDSEVEAVLNSLAHRVRVDVPQGLTEEEKTQARENIGASRGILIDEDGVPYFE